MCSHLLLAAPDTDNAGHPLYVTARCLELSQTLASSLYVVPVGQTFPLTAPPNVQNPLQWTSQYGFVGAGPHGLQSGPYFMDGLNTQGLSVGALWLPGTGYADSGLMPEVFFMDLPAWILGNYGDVATLAQDLPSVISVVGPTSTVAQDYAPLHFIATDATGKSLVIELIDGEMNLYGPDFPSKDAPWAGVLTNAPTYDWQKTNLASYYHLDPIGPETTQSGAGAPVGNGMLGLPGDTMSPSRFVRAVALRTGFGLLPSDGTGWLPSPGGAKPAKGPAGFAGTEQTLVNVGMQLVQLVQGTPYGTLLVQPTPGASTQPGDYTIWSVVRNHTDLRYYYTSAFDGIMRCADLNEISFESTGENIYPNSSCTQVIPPVSGQAWYEEAPFQSPVAAGRS